MRHIHVDADVEVLCIKDFFSTSTKKPTLKRENLLGKLKNGTWQRLVISKVASLYLFISHNGLQFPIYISDSNLFK